MNDEQPWWVAVYVGDDDPEPDVERHENVFAEQVHQTLLEGRPASWVILVDTPLFRVYKHKHDPKWELWVRDE